MQSTCNTALICIIGEQDTASQTLLFSTMTDANGNVCDLTGTNGSSLAHYEYGPFGQVTGSTGALKDSNLWQFSTKYYDAETELSYYGYRYYSPELRRWASRDPLLESAFLAEFLLQNRRLATNRRSVLLNMDTGNAYPYVSNRSIDIHDLLGLTDSNGEKKCCLDKPADYDPCDDLQYEFRLADGGVVRIWGYAACYHGEKRVCLSKKGMHADCGPHVTEAMIDCIRLHEKVHVEDDSCSCNPEKYCEAHGCSFLIEDQPAGEQRAYDKSWECFKKIARNPMNAEQLKAWLCMSENSWRWANNIPRGIESR